MKCSYKNSKFLIKVLFLSLTLITPICKSQQYSFRFTQSSDCNATTFYNPATFQCENCPIANTLPVTDKSRCECQGNAKTNFEPLLDGSVVRQLFSCTPCSTGQVVSRDKTECIIPAVCTNDQSLVERLDNGTALTTAFCETCTSDTGDLGETSNSACTFCQTCGCAQVKDGVCIEPSTSDSYQPLKSWWQRTRGLAAYYGCSALVPNVTACQVLSNMCVMSQYEITQQPCIDYNTLYDRASGSSSVDPPRTTDMPWIVYAGSVETSALVSEALLTIDDIDTVYSFKSAGEQKLRIVAARYSATGEFLGFEDVESSGLLQLCPTSSIKRRAAFRFGTEYELTCSITGEDFWDAEKYPNEFVELFLQFTQNQQQFLYPIPIRITNIFDNNAESAADWVFVRRFSLVDNLVGVETEGNEATSVQVATNFVMQVTTKDAEGSGGIFLPYISITYTQISIDDRSDPVDVGFSVNYQQNSSNDDTVFLAVYITINIFAVVYSFFELGAWRRREGLKYVDGKSFFMLILSLARNIGNNFFLVMAFYAFIRWAIYKGQDIVSVLPPDEGVETYYITFTGIAFGLKIIEYIGMIAGQSHIDIFFIDWEKVKKNDEKKISVWRTYFVANEWNELQVFRKLNLTTQLVLTILVLEVIGMKDVALETPLANAGYTQFPENYRPVYNKVFRFGVMSTTYFVLAVFQLLFNGLIYESRFEDKISDFIDLCSVANISVLMLTERQFGYYIHGRSVHGTSQTDMFEMATNLNKEEESLTSKRGLDPGTELQTFQIAIPQKFRYQFDRIYQNLQSGATIAGGAARRAGKFSKNVKATTTAYLTMKNFLITFFNHNFKEIDYFIKDKLFFESLFDMEFQEPIDRAILYNDEGANFSGALYYGREWLHISFEILFINFVDYFTENFILSITILFIVQKILTFIRYSMGRNNLVKKTLVDERFLI